MKHTSVIVTLHLVHSSEPLSDNNLQQLQDTIQQRATQSYQQGLLDGLSENITVAVDPPRTEVL